MDRCTSPFGANLISCGDFLDGQVQLLHDAQNGLDDLVVQQTAQRDQSTVLAFKRSVQESRVLGEEHSVCNDSWRVVETKTKIVN